MSDSLIEDEFDLTNWFNYENWHSQLDCVAYILPVLNELNSQLQTFEGHTFQVFKIQVYFQKIRLTKVYINDQYSNSPRPFWVYQVKQSVSK